MEKATWKFWNSDNQLIAEVKEIDETTLPVNLVSEYLTQNDNQSFSKVKFIQFLRKKGIVGKVNIRLYIKNNG